MIQPEILNKIEQHYNHACTKHPDFVQDMGVGKCVNICAGELARHRKILKFQNEWGGLSLSAVLACEMWEFFDAIANEKFREAIEEGYDIIAVVLRAIERIKRLEVAKHHFRDTTKMMPHLREVTKKEEVAVAKMETTTPTCKESLQVGNAAAMREALSDACYAMFNFLKTHYGSCYEEMAKALNKAKSALAKPPRNCDVGTPLEQAERFRKFCFAHTKKSGTDFMCYKNCPAKNYIGGWGIPYCQIRWGQLPYKSEVNHDRQNSHNNEH